MKVNYKKLWIEIIPENDSDEVYLESVLGLKAKGDTCTAERVAPYGLDGAWSYLKVRRTDKELAG